MCGKKAGQRRRPYGEGTSAWRVACVIAGILMAVALASVCPANSGEFDREIELAQIPQPDDAVLPLVEPANSGEFDQGIMLAQIPSAEPAARPAIAEAVEPDGAGTGVWSYSLVFDGTNDYIRVLDAADNGEFDHGTGDWTHFFRFKYTDGLGLRVVFSYTSGATQVQLIISQTARVLYTYIVDGTVSATGPANISITPDVWNTAAWVRSGNDIIVYTNGVADDTLDCTGLATLTAAVPKTVGSNPGGSQTFGGELADYRVWTSTGLTPAQIALEDANTDPYAVVTVAPDWGSGLGPGSGQAIWNTFGSAAWTRGSNATAVDDNDPAWGQRYRRATALTRLMDWLLDVVLPTSAHAAPAQAPTTYLVFPKRLYATARTMWEQQGLHRICELGQPWRTIDASGDSVYVHAAPELGHRDVRRFTDQVERSGSNLMRSVPVDSVRAMRAREAPH